MLTFRKVESYIQEKVKEAKTKDGTAVELFSICDIPVYLLTDEEEKIINKCLCSLPKSNGYITASSIADFFLPGDFYFKNDGYVLIF